jgi:L-serine dehydratase
LPNASFILLAEVLPGGLKVRRRAPKMYRDLCENKRPDPLVIVDWINLFTIAVNEENAADGRVVTAPTNGAAGIVPAVGHYYQRLPKHFGQRLGSAETAG